MQSIHWSTVLYFFVEWERKSTSDLIGIILCKHCIICSLCFCGFQIHFNKDFKLFSLAGYKSQQSYVLRPTETRALVSQVFRSSIDHDSYVWKLFVYHLWKTIETTHKNLSSDVFPFCTGLCVLSHSIASTCILIFQWLFRLAKKEEKRKENLQGNAVPNPQSDARWEVTITLHCFLSDSGLSMTQ